MTRKGWVAVALSVAIPGLGHVYAGTFGIALAIGAFDRLAPAAVDLLAGAGLVGVKALAVTKLALPLSTRLFAAVHALRAARAQEPWAPPGAYGLYAGAWFVAAFVLGRLISSFVTAVPLTEAAHGLRAGDRVLTSKLGSAWEPRPGALAVWFTDWPDGGAASPVVPSLRQVRVGRITDAGAGSFEIAGEVVPNADYGGEPVGVLSAPGASGRSLDWGRVGLVPTP